MAHREIREHDAKVMIAEHLHRYLRAHLPPRKRVVQITADTDWSQLVENNPWLNEEKLVAKPDMLFGKRKKLGLISVGESLKKTRSWIESKIGKSVEIGPENRGELSHFIVEPFVPHEREYYFAITTERDTDCLLFSPFGGVDIEEGWSEKVRELRVPVLSKLDPQRLEGLVCEGVPEVDRPALVSYLNAMYLFFKGTGLVYFEVNPFCLIDNRIVFLDVVARVDDQAPTGCSKYWTWDDFPRGFGAQKTDGERHIEELDAKTGASLKFQLVNPNGRVWLLVSGGGASVIFADTVCDLGFAKELANYGEYSGNPSLDETWDYTRTLLSQMTKDNHPNGKVLLIGGGVANFTDTAKTFRGVIKALKEYRQQLIDGKVRIFVRRGGPNYKEALRLMKQCGEDIGVPIDTYGPETNMTEIVKMGVDAL